MTKILQCFLKANNFRLKVYYHKFESEEASTFAMPWRFALEISSNDPWELPRIDQTDFDSQRNWTRLPGSFDGICDAIDEYWGQYKVR